MKKEQVTIEKETVTREVNGDKMEKTTIRVFIMSEGKTRSIVFTPKQFEKFRKEVNDVKF